MNVMMTEVYACSAFLFLHSPGVYSEEEDVICN